MEIDIEQLKKSSLEFHKKLRLPIEILKINIEDDWKDFTDFQSDIIENKYITEIKMVLGQSIAIPSLGAMESLYANPKTTLDSVYIDL